ncbi:MAG TPA: nucleotidyltransferase domain-containing protein [Polyangia bacterium]|nr:nucleotidyltransferase domain-containing protein [Polyangia bacterium]
MDQEGIEAMALAIADAHACHTVILYGSRARGNADDRSDVDLVCIREGGPSLRDARVVDGLYFDAFIYPEDALAAVDPVLLRILGGRALRQRGGAGTALLDRVRDLFAKGPDRLAADDRNMRIVWAHKTLARLRRDDEIETRYRRMSFLVQALEDYFALRTLWFLGPRDAFAWLQIHDDVACSAFEAAMHSDADPTVLAALVTVVYGALPSDGR